MQESFQRVVISQIHIMISLIPAGHRIKAWGSSFAKACDNCELRDE